MVNSMAPLSSNNGMCELFTIILPYFILLVVVAVFSAVADKLAVMSYVKQCKISNCYKLFFFGLLYTNTHSTYKINRSHCNSGMDCS